jgi:hypothetical protein
MSDPNGAFQIENKALKSTTTGSRVEIPFSASTTSFYAEVTLHATNENYIYLKYIDSNNWLRIHLKAGWKRIILEEKVSGTVTQLSSVFSGGANQEYRLGTVNFSYRNTSSEVQVGEGDFMRVAAPDSSLVPPDIIAFEDGGYGLVIEGIIAYNAKDLN